MVTLQQLKPQLNPGDIASWKCRKLILEVDGMLRQAALRTAKNGDYQLIIFATKIYKNNQAVLLPAIEFKLASTQDYLDQMFGIA